jgi:flavin reductase (DIM6/NTAB) family NADH-FMN oxidoreductase RutF
MPMKKSFGPKTLIFPTPVWIIGTYDKEGKPNAMTVAWGGVCSSQPPCVAVSIRKATYSHAAIIERKAFTVNVPSESYVKEADYCGIYSGKNMDKFSATRFTAVRGEKIDAPYIKEFPLVLECKLVSTVEIGIHTHFVGEIVDVKADESVLGENGMPDMLKVKPILYAPEVRSYYGVGSYLGQAHAIGKKV